MNNFNQLPQRIHLLPTSTDAWNRFEVESLNAEVFVEPGFDLSVASDVVDIAALASRGRYNPVDKLGPGQFGVVSQIGGCALKVSLQERKYTLADALANHGLQVGLSKIHREVLDEIGMDVSAPKHHVIVSPINPYSPRVYAASLMDLAPGEKAF